ncbi:MAG: sensor histidine kinase [Planctomycetaceae bacterium]
MTETGRPITEPAASKVEPSCRGLIVIASRPAPIPPASEVTPALRAPPSPAAGDAVKPLDVAPGPDDGATSLQSELDALRACHAADVADLRAQVLEARKQANLGELLGTTTHEFNNALTTILNYARMGLRHRDQPTRDKALERILSAGTRAARITASVLSMARGQSTRFEPVDVPVLVEDVLVLLEREMMKYRVQVEREFAPVPRVSANPGQLQQVLLNLMVNARQAMAGGGRLILRLAHDEAAGLVDLMVRDTGCGMTPEVMRRMFDPHFTTKAGPDETGKGGSGMGLAACREIVEAHRGRIRVESAPGRGTAVTIRLPAIAVAAATDTAADRRSA